MDGMPLNGEAGASDNRLSINPNDFDGIAKTWEDGKEYTLEIRVVQESPGEFTVTDLKETGAGEEAVETPEAEPAEGEPAAPAGPAYGNPAVAKMMQARMGG